MPNEIHVNFRLPLSHARKLRAVAEANNTSPSLAARHILIDSLDDTLREELTSQIESLQEELAALKASHREIHDELKAFRTEFKAALRKATDR